jgi:hypothetical protein
VEKQRPLFWFAIRTSTTEVVHAALHQVNTEGGEKQSHRFRTGVFWWWRKQPVFFCWVFDILTAISGLSCRVFRHTLPTFQIKRLSPSSRKAYSIVGPVGSFQTPVSNNHTMWHHNGADTSTVLSRVNLWPQVLLHPSDCLFRNTDSQYSGGINSGNTKTSTKETVLSRSSTEVVLLLNFEKPFLMFVVPCNIVITEE